MTSRRKQLWVSRIDAQKSRMADGVGWFPFPFLIPVGLAVVVLVKSMIGTNPRHGNPADILPFNAAPAQEASIWFSVTPIGREIVVTTAERQVFRWPQQLKDNAALQPFTDWLKKKVANEIETTALSKKTSSYQTTAVIAPDQSLKFLHVKPILYALAEARVRSYAFESKAMNDGSGVSGSSHTKDTSDHGDH